MPAGCEFFCNNEECEQYKSGFVLTCLWPLGDIDEIIDARNVSKIQDFRDGLIKRKSEGRKYSCIIYPNVNEIETKGYRVNRWCNKCKRILEFDVLLEDGAKTFEEAIAKKPTPTTCSGCNEETVSFEQAIEDGIDCLFCKKKMKSSRWFSNETTEER